MAERNAELAAAAEDLGWAATAAWLRAGRLLPEMAVQELRRAVARKRAFLISHDYRPGTCGEETHERVSSWCDRAEALLAPEPSSEEER